MARILVVEDESLVADVVEDCLHKFDHETRSVRDGASALTEIRAWSPELLVLDLNLGGSVNGLDICREVRADKRLESTFIVVLTGEGGDTLEETLFDAGADDYVRKQGFSARTFARRIEAVLRRKRPDPVDHKVELGGLALDLPRREALFDGQDLKLTPTEFDVLLRLAEEPGRTLSRTELLDRGEVIDDPATSRAVDMHIKQIRKKLGPNSSVIGTVYGAGYRLQIGAHVAE